MCDDTFGWWFRIGLTALAAGLATYWLLMVRWQRRELRETQALKAELLANIRTVRILFEDAQALSGDDDHPPPPPH